jgi:hypothetical protein
MSHDIASIKKWKEVEKLTQEKCGKEFRDIVDLYDFSFSVWDSIESLLDDDTFFSKCCNSLAYMRYFELTEIAYQNIFLVNHGLYRNVFDNIRYILESIVQAVYIDSRHPKTRLLTKIEILKEVEDKIEYHAIRLIDELQINHKDLLKKEYKDLSRIIHPSHKQIVCIQKDMNKGKMEFYPSRVDCKEIRKICESTRMMYNIFFFLLLPHFPEVIEKLKENNLFLKYVKKHRTKMLATLFNIKLN